MSETERLGPDAEFEERLKEGRFCIQRCEDTGRHVFYPRRFSPYSGSDNLTWVEACGNGKVYSTTIIRQKPERGGDYNLSIIELAEGPKLMSRVESVRPEEVAIGMAVKARIARDGDTAFVVFDPA
ncbi:Zn-ribbon domain-containing OB-fold protein [Afifella pfennigii]|uniref:Zn-ribbon domain-containing OB-fold protein n=1 Tax=Afifella pfennigii TaxID=209897 RepID=UPI00047BF7DF|nr:OB-fold domain-containing protein [Afifella pfennigii]